MHAGNQMRFAMAIHMLQKSNPAGRQALENKRGATRRRLGRAEHPAGSGAASSQNSHEG
jgi:hypothetical protein